jgi:DNA-binding NarL/FixJ family response regulator
VTVRAVTRHHRIVIEYPTAVSRIDISTHRVALCVIVRSPSRNDRLTHGDVVTLVRMMTGVAALGIIEAACNLAASRHDTLRAIARAATSAIPQGPVAVGCFDSNAQLDHQTLHLERADSRYAVRLLECEQLLPFAIRRLILSLAPRAIRSDPDLCKRLPDRLRAMARDVFPLCVLANTGDGGGLHIVFGDPDMADWPRARMRYFNAVARHLAIAWRVRMALHSGAASPAIAAELRLDGTPSSLSREASTPTAREALRRAVLARERARAIRRPSGELWPALIAGRWSLCDAFTAAGTRYVVAYENPVERIAFRALQPRERAVLEHALAGRSGKWVALELALSESAVTRTLHTALRKLGVGDTAALAGVRTALFEPLEGVDPRTGLAIAELPAAARSLPSLSDAERDIVAGILGGKRIAAIAHDRQTSPRTVAHQLASVYRKLGVSSHRELLALIP